MKTILALTLLGALFTEQGFGQCAQADMVKRRAKETVNQNNVRQGVPPPQAPPRPAPPVQPGATAPVVTQAHSIAKLTSDLAGFKTSTTATAEQKQQFTIDLAQSARGRKPSLGTVKTFVDSLTTALTGATLTPEHQGRLAQGGGRERAGRRGGAASVPAVVDSFARVDADASGPCILRGSQELAPQR